MGDSELPGGRPWAQQAEAEMGQGKGVELLRGSPGIFVVSTRFHGQPYLFGP